MKTFEFIVVAAGLDPTAEDFEARFYEVGCDDATISFQRGAIIIDFAREAASIGEALGSAVRDVGRAGAIVERIEPDPLVSLSDMAARAALTRAAMSNYASALRAKGFPRPVAKVTSDSPLWDWADVARWLCQNGRLAPEVSEEADAVSAANARLKAALYWVDAPPWAEAKTG